MAQLALVPSGGIGRYLRTTPKIIRMVKYGCTNRPFYHIVVMEQRKHQFNPCIEQVGSYDPMVNENDEKLVAFNYDRIKHWLGKGALVSDPVAVLLGLSGYFPIHPRTYMRAWRRRRYFEEKTTAEPKEGQEKETEG